MMMSHSCSFCKSNFSSPPCPSPVAYREQHWGMVLFLASFSASWGFFSALAWYAVQSSFQHRAGSALNQCLKYLGFPKGRNRDFTFFTVMAIFMQYEAISALAHIAPKGVDTFVLATSIVFGALVLVWAGSNQQTLS